MSSLFDDLPLPGFELPAARKPAGPKRPAAAGAAPLDEPFDPPVDEEPPPYEEDVPYPAYEEAIPADLFRTDYAAQTERDAYYRNGHARTVIDPASCWRA